MPQILQHKSFRDLWLGQAISQFGDAFYYVTFMYMAQKITGKIETVGWIGALEATPYLLFSAYSGVLADRFDRRKIMLYSDLFSGLLLLLFAGFLVFEAKPPVWLMLFMAFCLSTIRCFFLPAKSAAIPNLLPPDKVLEGNAFSATTQSLMPMLGLALSASVMAPLYELSARWFFLSCVLVNLASFFASAFFIARLPKIQPDLTDRHDAHPVEDFKQGLAYMKSRRELVILLVMLTVFRLMVSPFFVVYVAANDQWFGGKPSTIMWMEFSFFLGMIVMSPIVGKFKIARPTLTFAYGLAAVGLFVMPMAFSRFFPLMLVWNVICGLAVPVVDIPINAYLQLSVPDAYRGRVNSVISMIGFGIMPIGMVFAGALVENWGITTAFLVMGIGMFLAGVVGPLDRTYREARMPEAA